MGASNTPNIVPINASAKDRVGLQFLRSRACRNPAPSSLLSGRLHCQRSAWRSVFRSFVRAHGISEGFFYKLKKQGEGPREMKVGARTLISFESAAEWRRAREKQRD